MKQRENRNREKINTEELLRCRCYDQGVLTLYSASTFGLREESIHLSYSPATAQMIDTDFQLEASIRLWANAKSCEQDLMRNRRRSVIRKTNRASYQSRFGIYQIFIWRQRQQVVLDRSVVHKQAVAKITSEREGMSASTCIVCWVVQRLINDSSLCRDSAAWVSMYRSRPGGRMVCQWRSSMNE